MDSQITCNKVRPSTVVWWPRHNLPSLRTSSSRCLTGYVWKSITWSSDTEQGRASPGDQATFPPTGAIPAPSLAGDHFISTHCNGNQEPAVLQGEVTLYQHVQWHLVCHQPLPASKKRAENKQELSVKRVSVRYQSQAFLLCCFCIQELTCSGCLGQTAPASCLQAAPELLSTVQCQDCPHSRAEQTQRVPAEQLPTELPPFTMGIFIYIDQDQSRASLLFKFTIHPPGDKFYHLKTCTG